MEDLLWLLEQGYAVSRRDPALLSMIAAGLEQRAKLLPDAAYMIFDPLADREGFLLLGDNLPEMLKEARAHLEVCGG